jgi:hypothetical protein
MVMERNNIGFALSEGCGDASERGIESDMNELRQGVVKLSMFRTSSATLAIRTDYKPKIIHC